MQGERSWLKRLAQTTTAQTRPLLALNCWDLIKTDYASSLTVLPCKEYRKLTGEKKKRKKKPWTIFILIRRHCKKKNHFNIINVNFPTDGSSAIKRSWNTLESVLIVWLNANAARLHINWFFIVTKKKIHFQEKKKISLVNAFNLGMQLMCC